MLSEIQKARLLKRKELKKDKKTRHQAYHNDMAVKKMLKRFLDDIIDAELIMLELPPDTTRDIIAPDHIVNLFDMLKLVLSAAGAKPVTEKTLFSDNPDDINAARYSLAVYHNCNMLRDRFGPADLVGKMTSYYIISLTAPPDAFSILYDRLTDEEKITFDRIKELIPPLEEG